METLKEIIRQFEEHKDKYSAIFNPETGKIISIGPSICFQNNMNKIEVEKDLAEDILTDKIHISNCFVDIDSGSLEIAEFKSIRKIDDVLHRIPLIEYVKDEEICDLFVNYDQQKKEFSIELSKDLGGTKVTRSNKKRTIYWEGDTVMNFYLTKYNDPHWIIYNFDVKIEELQKESKTYKDVLMPKKFSVFTRRILKKYVLEIK